MRGLPDRTDIHTTGMKYVCITSATAVLPVPGAPYLVATAHRHKD